jgi:hypothetical protein
MLRLKRCAGPKGCILIAKLHDRLRIWKAAERAMKDLGIIVKLVIVADDCYF